MRSLCFDIYCFWCLNQFYEFMYICNQQDFIRSLTRFWIIYFLGYFGRTIHCSPSILVSSTKCGRSIREILRNYCCSSKYINIFYLCIESLRCHWYGAINLLTKDSKILMVNMNGLLNYHIEHWITVSRW